MRLHTSEQELDRRGWASLLVRKRSPSQPREATLTGSTETCWNPFQRLHSDCAVWGDYVRPPGWIVRIFDPDAPAGQSCQWSFAGAVFAETDPRKFVDAPQTGTTTVAGDCREPADLPLFIEMRHEIGDRRVDVRQAVKGSVTQPPEQPSLDDEHGLLNLGFVAVPPRPRRQNGGSVMRRHFGVGPIDGCGAKIGSKAYLTTQQLWDESGRHVKLG
jgi:hypothetical protein